MNISIVLEDFFLKNLVEGISRPRKPEGVRLQCEHSGTLVQGEGLSGCRV